MSEGLKHDVILNIGFLNLYDGKDAKKLEAYKAAFDVVLINDETLDYVIDIVNRLITK